MTSVLHSRCSKMIILEGPDGAGKSTLATSLSNSLGWRLIHGGGPLADRAEFLARVQEKGFLIPNSVIFDRTSYVSELVYAILAGRQPVCSFLELETMLLKIRPILIYCRRASAKAMLQSVSSGPKAHKSPEFLEQVKREHPRIVKRYDEIFHALFLGIKKYPGLQGYDWKTDSYEDLLKWIINQTGEV